MTLLLIFVLLYSSFNSLRSTALILLNIPLALVGGVVALWVSGQNLSVPASVGFIALFGIASAERHGPGDVPQPASAARTADGRGVRARRLSEASAGAHDGLHHRLGLIPLLFATGTGSEVQRPLATVVIGGLVTSTALTLLVLPAIYRWFAERRADIEL